MRFLGLSYHPVGIAATPPMEGNVFRDGTRPHYPLRRGGALCATGWSIPWRRPGRIRMNQYRRCMSCSPGRTLYTNRPAWTQGNFSLCRRTYSPTGMNCSQCPYNPLQPQHNRTDTTWTARRQMHPSAQLPELTQLFFSSRAPVSQKVSRTSQTERTHRAGRNKHN